MDAHQSQSILFELLRSFTTLARTLNLSHAVRELNSTRQTVRRHVTLLEEMLGEELFELRDRQYTLTESGRRVLPEAEDLLARAQGWVSGQARLVNGLFSISYTENPDFDYHLQQHPISLLQGDDDCLLRRALSCWAISCGEIEHPAMSEIRPYLLIFRSNFDEWLLAEIGLESSFASWFGWAAARSSIGRKMVELPGGFAIGRLMRYPFQEILRTQGVWLDHVHTQVRQKENGPFVPISYRRLLMGCSFPDGTFALGALIERTYDIEIKGVSREKIQSMPEELVMNLAAKTSKLKSIR